MNTLFLLICGMSLVFFGYFFIECHKDNVRKKPHRSSVVKIPPAIQAIDSASTRNSLVHLEKQMAGFVAPQR